MTLSLLERPLPPFEEHDRPVERGATLRVRAAFDVPAQRVFDAWLDPQVAGAWLFATATRPMACAEIDARVGGAFCLTEWHDGALAAHIGRYLEIEPHRRLAFELSSHMHAHALTRVSVEIANRRRGCALSVTHDNVPRARVAYTRARWMGILYGLGVTLRA